ncbi:MAG: energy-coupling factor ABC transporter ATP-binding protein [Candidatus Eisenbacteria bacterium]
MLDVQNLRFGYPGGPEVIRGMTLSLERGSSLALVGENGSGKTTLARLLCGLLKPTAGVVRVGDADTANPQRIYDIRRRVGIVFQDPDDQIVETTVERELGFGLRNLGLDVPEVGRRVDQALDVFGIGHLRKRSCNLLSAGEKQTVTVASIYAMRPDYIILDESTSLLDSVSRRKLIGVLDRLLEETGAGLAFISMRLEDVWLCDRVVFLKDGTIGFDGNKVEFLKYLKEHGHPLSGMARLACELMDGVPGITAKMAEWRELSAAAVSETVIGLGGNREGGRTCR